MGFSSLRSNLRFSFLPAAAANGSSEDTYATGTAPSGSASFSWRSQEENSTFGRSDETSSPTGWVARSLERDCAHRSQVRAEARD